MRKTLVIAGAASIVSLAAGLAVGYKLAVHRLNETYNEQMEEELRKTAEFYERNQRKFADPADAVKVLVPEKVDEIKAAAAVAAVTKDEISTEDLERVLDGLKYNKITPAEGIKAPVKVDVSERITRPSVVHHSVFENQGETLDVEDDEAYDAMMEARADEIVYLVTKEEHFENAHEFDMVTLTYYAGDNVLADENDQPVEAFAEAIGTPDNLQFGRWSEDAKIVYIRNEKLAIEYEILKSDGRYAIEVLGLDPE